MRVYVSTCDKYKHLLNGFAHQFNKYWGTQTEVHVIGYGEAVPLPGNFVYHSLEPKETKPWTTNMHTFVAKQPHDHFVFLFDDYWLTEPVNHDRVDAMRELLLTRKLAKADLSANTAYFAHSAYASTDYVIAKPDAHYRTSTQPAIWNRDYMLKLLKPGLSPWAFELQDVTGTRDMAIVGPRTQIYVYANVYYKGSPDVHMLSRLSKADQAELTARGALSGMPADVQAMFTGAN